MRNLIVLFLCSTFFLVDIYFDLQHGIPWIHIWHELALFIVAVSALVWQIRTIIKKNKHIHHLKTELLETKKTYQEWKEKSQTGSQNMRQLIDDQFTIWQLSHSEKDVALLLVKGLSMKEIADIRATQEKTIRQQATSIYRKSTLSGRQELAAFFLEDILSQPL